MDSDTLWLALGLMLVFEGLFPFMSPGGWRKLFSQLLQLSDGQLRFYALISISCGLGLIWWLAP